MDKITVELFILAESLHQKAVDCAIHTMKLFSNWHKEKRPKFWDGETQYLYPFLGCLMDSFVP